MKGAKQLNHCLSYLWVETIVESLCSIIGDICTKKRSRLLTSSTKDLLCSRVCLPTSKEKKAVVCNDILTDYKLQHHSSTSHEVQSAWYLDQRPFEVSPTVDRLNAGKCGLYEF